jgi:hypothetical protein
MRSGIRALTIVFGGLSLAPLVRADEPPSLSGQWSATALTESWSIGDWGSACGPKPSAGGERGGTATINQSGGELSITGVGHAFSTSSCWEPLPGLVRTSHTAGARSWRTTCKSPPGDPRQSSLVTTVTAANDQQISFDETGQYQFVIKGQNCTASVRRSRFYRRVASTLAPSTTPTAESAAQALSTAQSLTLEPTAVPSSVLGDVPVPVPKTASPACALPGPPARIEVRPSNKLIRPGESFDFSAAVVDSHGCRLSIAPSFRLEDEANGVSVAATGKVHVDDNAAEGEHKVTATVGARSVSVTLDVVSRDRYDALLAQGGYDPSGASTDAAVARLESDSVGARSTVLEDDSGKRRTLFVAIVGAAALSLGLLGLALVRRSRKRVLTQSVASVRAAPAPPPPRPAPATVCPTCREEFGPEAQFCPRDGNRLLPLERGTAVGPTGAVCPVCGQGYDPGVSVCPKHDEPLVPPLVYQASRTIPVIETRKICPVCGAQFTGESQFCGSCGAALVPVN